MNGQGHAGFDSLYDQDADSRYDQHILNEDGYFTNAQLGLRRSASQRELMRQAAAAQPLLVRSTGVGQQGSTGLNQQGSTGLNQHSRRKVKVQKYKRRRRSAGYVLPLLVLLGSLGGLAWYARDYFVLLETETPVEQAVVVQAVEVPTASTALFVHTDGSGATIGFTVASIDSVGGSSVVLVPASVMVEIPGYGLDTLLVAGRYGGVDLASLAVENLLTIDFDHVVDLTPAAMSELTRSFDPLLVENPSRIDVVNSDDRIEVLYPTGAMLLASRDSADFLSRRAIDESDLDRLVRHQQFWSAYFIARADVVGDSFDVDTNLEAFLDELAARRQDTDYRILDVQLIGGEDELYGVDRSALPAVIAQLQPDRSPDVPPTAVQLLNGVGVPGLAPPIADLLVDAAASVQLSANASRFDHERTQIVYYRDDQFEAATGIRDVLGVGEVVKALEPIDVVDVTVVIGADLAAVVSSAQRDVTPFVGTDAGSPPVSGQNEESEPQQ